MLPISNGVEDAGGGFPTACRSVIGPDQASNLLELAVMTTVEDTAGQPRHADPGQGQEGAQTITEPHVCAHTLRLPDHWPEGGCRNNDGDSG